MSWTQVSYTYDGSFSGFLTCVYESYRHKEAPAAFSTPEDPQISLYPERPVKSDPAKARQVYLSLARKISPSARELVTLGGAVVEQQELVLPFSTGASPLPFLAAAGTLLLLGVPPEELPARFRLPA